MICTFCKGEIQDPTLNQCPHCGEVTNSSLPDASTQIDTRKTIRKVLLWILVVVGVLCFTVYSYNVQNSATRTVSRLLLCIDTKDYEGILSLLHVEDAAVNKDTTKALVAWLDSQPSKSREMRTTLTSQATTVDRNNGHPTGNFVANSSWALVSHDNGILRSFKIRVKSGEIYLDALEPGQIMIPGITAQPTEVKSKSAIPVLPGKYEYQFTKANETQVIKNTITVEPGQRARIYVAAPRVDVPSVAPTQSNLPYIPTPDDGDGLIKIFDYKSIMVEKQDTFRIPNLSGVIISCIDEKPTRKFIVKVDGSVVFQFETRLYPSAFVQQTNGVTFLAFKSAEGSGVFLRDFYIMAISDATKNVTLLDRKALEELDNKGFQSTRLTWKDDKFVIYYVDHIEYKKVIDTYKISVDFLSSPVKFNLTGPELLGRGRYSRG